MQTVPGEMSDHETSTEIDDSAALWAARIDARPLTPEEERELDLWLSGDSRRQGAFARARAVSFHMARAQALGRDFFPDALAARSTPSRRFFLTAGAGGALAAGVAGAITLYPYLVSKRFNTRMGEVRRVTLEDRSVLTLNTASQVRISFSDAKRVVDLIEGEVLFDVIPDPMREFIVRAGPTLVRTVGASFSVARLADAPINVLVRAGAVDVSRTGAAQLQKTRINAMQVVTLTPVRAVVGTAPANEIDRNLAWRDGQIGFEGETLREAAREFARYSSVRIIFADPSVARETVTGLYVSTDPIGFAQAVGMAFDLQVTVSGNEVVLSRPSVKF